MVERINQFLGEGLDFLAGRPHQLPRWFSIAWNLLLYMGGLLLWGHFMDWGKLNRGGQVNQLFHDWTYITVPRLATLQYALIHGLLPLHIPNSAPLNDLTNRFLVIPDQILFPQILLLRFLDLGRFIMVQIWLIYTLGFIGLWLLQRKFKLSPLAFTVFFFLFNFNGHILAHISVGHLTWTGYFLYSWLVLFVLDLFGENRVGWGWIAKISILLFIILLQGSYHQYIYALFFLAFLLLVLPKRAGVLVGALVFSVLLSLARLLPSFLLIGTHQEFSRGYTDLWSIITAFSRVLPPDGLTTQIGNWEVTLYIGILGSIFLLYFGIYHLLANQDNGRLQLLLVPIFGLTFLSFKNVFMFLRNYVPLPLLTGERVSSRILSLAFVFLLALACIEFQYWLNRQAPKRLVVVILSGLALIETLSLWPSYQAWNFINVMQNFPPLYVNPATQIVVNHYNDRTYIGLLIIGLLISIATLLFLIRMVRREKHLFRVKVFEGAGATPTSPAGLFPT